MLEQWHTQLKDFIRDKQGEGVCIPEMTEQSVKKALTSLQINKSARSDKISAHLLKATTPAKLIFFRQAFPQKPLAGCCGYATACRAPLML